MSEQWTHSPALDTSRIHPTSSTNTQTIRVHVQVYNLGHPLVTGSLTLNVTCSTGVL